eukprot:COSAG01_NODE_233_length_20982_cov_14.774458_8_plen_151_part_00
MAVSVTAWLPNTTNMELAHNGWYPPTLGSSDTHINVDPTQWPCIAPWVHGIMPLGACAVCSAAKPCLFDILHDPAERFNVAAEQPVIVALLARQLATYAPYVNKSMSTAELRDYDCLVNTAAPTAPFGTWWGDFFGPCCRPKEVAKGGSR